ncbi:hypothetical protein H0H92_003825, partial [Tricholoma furcatifolium]
MDRDDEEHQNSLAPLDTDLHPPSSSTNVIPPPQHKRRKLDVPARKAQENAKEN